MRTIFISIIITCLFKIECSSQNVDISSIIDKLNKDSLYSYIEELSGVKKCLIDGELVILERTNKNGNETATKYLVQKLSGFGYQPSVIQCVNNTSNVENVISEISGNTFPEKRIIICAHYDSEGFGEFGTGADDNASGCAVVIELARILKSYKPNRTIVFAFWDAEEWGLIGSKCYAKSAKEENKLIEAVINIDMIGYDPNNKNKSKVNIRTTGQNLELWKQIKYLKLLYSINLNLDSINLQQSGSDMLSFWNNGYNGVSFAEDESNPYYHSEQDKIEHLNFEYLLENSKLVTALLIQLVNKGIISDIKDISSSSKLDIIFPNPASDYIDISSINPMIKHEVDEDFDIQIFDIFGENVINVVTRYAVSLRIDVSNLVPGIYFIKIGE